MFLVEMFDGNRYKINCNSLNEIDFKVISMANIMYDVSHICFKKFRFFGADNQFDMCSNFFKNIDSCPFIEVDRLNEMYHNK